MGELEPQGRYDGPVSRLARAREAERLARKPPIVDPPPFTADQTAKLNDLDRVTIWHHKKTNPE